MDERPDPDGGPPGTDGELRWASGRTWYRVVGERFLGTGPAALVVCHGGPGMTHDYLESLGRLSADGRACVLYDQIGAGRSDHRADAPAESWTPDLFVRELRCLVEHLRPTDGFHLLGHSWGGMLALELATRRPSGLRSLVLADTFASAPRHVDALRRLVAALPDDERTALVSHDPAVRAPALRSFQRTHVFRGSTVPDGLRRTMVAMAEAPHVYRTMMGPDELSMTGTMRDWDISDRLVDVRVPALLVSGVYDEVAPDTVEHLHSRLPNARWELFESSSHMPHLEEPVRFRHTVSDFLADVDGTGTGTAAVHSPPGTPPSQIGVANRTPGAP